MIIGQGRFNKYISRKVGNHYKRKLFSNKEALIKKSLVYKKEIINLDLVSFSGSGSLIDQILSIISFVKSIGVPNKWTIYSDGTYSKKDINLLTQFDFVVLESSNDHNTWQESKFYSFSNHIVNRTTIFLDSDVLFFHAFNMFLKNFGENNWVLPENMNAKSLDEDYLPSNFFLTPINSGFFILNSQLDNSVGADYLELKKSKNDISHFTEQTALNKIFENNNMKALDPRYFLLTTSDHFKLGLHETPQTAMRHYVGPIRFKMYCSFIKNFN